MDQILLSNQFIGYIYILYRNEGYVKYIFYTEGETEQMYYFGVAAMRLRSRLSCIQTPARMPFGISITIMHNKYLKAAIVRNTKAVKNKPKTEPSHQKEKNLN